ncbi:MAG: signal peptide peptidase SppA [Agarilytica sp.]
MNILGKLWKIVTLLRSSISNIIFLIFVLVLFTAIFSGGPKPLPSEAPLLITITGQLVDEKTLEPSIFDLLDESKEDPETLVRDVIYAIKHATDDKRISALVFNLNRMNGGSFSKLEEIGQAITQFKTSGKPVLAYADQYSQQQYFLASYADTIYLNTMGNVTLTGFGRYGTYFKEAADKLAIKFHLFKVGNYKDAAEPFVRNSMSAASREHNASWINELWGRYTSTVESHRNLPNGAIKSHIDSLQDTLSQTQSDFSTIALETGLVDNVQSRIHLYKTLGEQFGEDEDSGYFTAIGLKRYLNHIKPRVPQQQNNIGLIVASGTIVDGSAPAGQIGGDSLASLIRQAADDDSLKALIIRVDSGGGSAFASEVIREEIANARENGLPIYISMGSVAASGGYWIATAANEIWALPSTITGSIGVWGLVPNVSESMKQLGIHNDGFGTTPLSDLFQIDRPMSEAAQQVFQSGVESVYRRFISLSAESRQQTPEAIHEIAQGRVWTGAQAHDLGLIDKLGTLNDLVSAVEAKHELQNTQLKLIEHPLSPAEQFMRAVMEEAAIFGNEIKSSVLGNELKALSKTVKNNMPLHNIQTKENQLNIYSLCIECVSL